MKLKLCAIVVACQLAGWFLASSTRADINVDVQFSAGLEIQSANDFYQPLEAYGEWIDAPRYGRCWRPVSVAPDWRPYEVGYWEWTDCGWYWQSDEPWSWACYHYGGWEFDPSYGWIWVPGTEWAPAWVTWREGGDYIGWAPCGPGGIALSVNFFGFVDVHHFHDHFRPRSFVSHNTTIINRTRVINRFDRETRDIGGRRERVVVNRGPDVQSIQRSTGRSFEARPITQVVAQTAIPTTVRRRSDSQIQHRTLNEADAPRRNGNRNNYQSGRDNNNSRDYNSSNGRDYNSSSQNSSQGSRSYDRTREPGQGAGARDLNRGGATSSSGTATGTYQNEQPSSQRQGSYQSQGSYQTPTSSRDRSSYQNGTYQAQPGVSTSVSPNTSDRQPATTQNRTVTPTGRESTRSSNPSRNYEAQPSTPPQTPPHQAIPGASTRPQQPSSLQEQRTVTPTGRDQSRVLEQRNATPETQHPRPMTPTGRDQSRVLEQQNSKPAVTPEARSSRTIESQSPPSASSRSEINSENRSSLPASVREKPIAPTGRESQRNYESSRPEPTHSQEIRSEPSHSSPSAVQHEAVPRAESHPQPAQSRGEGRSDDNKRDRDH